MINFKKIIFLLITSSICNITLNAHKFATITTWAEECFKTLPEHSNEGFYNSPSAVTPEEIEQLFNTFKNIIDKSPLQNNKKWLDDAIAEAVLPTTIITTDKDTVSPYVKKISIPSESSICFMGDLHGSIHALIRNLLRLLALGYINKDWRLKNNTYFIFLGDFVDRGAYGTECWCTLMQLFSKNPEHVILIRGNHEEEAQWQRLGFKKDKHYDGELIEKFKTNANSIADSFRTFCAKLPHAVFIESGTYNGKPAIVQCCHGGIEPRFDPRPLFQDNNKEFALIDINTGFQGFNWSDFTGQTHSSAMQDIPKIQFQTIYRNQIPDWQVHLNNVWKTNNDRGAGFLADIPDTNNYFNLFAICGFFRGHQDLENSFKLVKNQHHGVVTWDTMLTDDLSTLQNTGVRMEFFLNNPETMPVFTFTTATEARSLPNEGFGIITTHKNYADWIIRPHIYKFAWIESSNSRFINAEINFATKRVNFNAEYTTNNPNMHATRVTLLNEPTENIVDPINILLSTLEQELTTLQTKLTELHNQLLALQQAIPVA